LSKKPLAADRLKTPTNAKNQYERMKNFVQSEIGVEKDFIMDMAKKIFKVNKHF